MSNNYNEMNELELFSILETSRDGLTSQEALKRLVRYGKNELPKKRLP